MEYYMIEYKIINEVMFWIFWLWLNKIILVYYFLFNDL